MVISVVNFEEKFRKIHEQHSYKIIAQKKAIPEKGTGGQATETRYFLILILVN